MEDYITKCDRPFKSKEEILFRAPGPIGTQEFALVDCNGDTNILHQAAVRKANKIVKNKAQVVPGDFGVYKFLKSQFGMSKGLNGLLKISFKTKIKPYEYLTIKPDGIYSRGMNPDNTERDKLAISFTRNSTQYINADNFRVDFDNQNQIIGNLAKQYCYLSGILIRSQAPFLESLKLQKTRMSKEMYGGANIYISPEFEKSVNLIGYNCIPSAELIQRKDKTNTTISFRSALFNEDMKIVGAIEKIVLVTKLEALR